jgi:hypothetical protein
VLVEFLAKQLESKSTPQAATVAALELITALPEYQLS